ncbi:uncharacterized protein [Montipora foliosa]|uniref:uncharacterized protein n=1 Tax=Montipora foliosa TaxID=591990 RepID=UPI0035F1D9C7
MEKNKCGNVPQCNLKNYQLSAKGELHPQLKTSAGTENSAFVKSRRNETIFHKWTLPVKKVVFADIKSIKDAPYNNEKGTLVLSKVKQKKDDESYNKDTFPSQTVAEQPKVMPINEAEMSMRKKSKSFSYQSQLPNLFTLMSEQKSSSFRTCARDTFSGKANIEASLEMGRSHTRTNSKKESVTTRAQSTKGLRRSSSLPTASDTLRKFPMLFSRSDFETVYIRNLEEMWNKGKANTRRHSVPEGLDRRSFGKGKTRPSSAVSDRVEFDSVMSSEAKAFRRAMCTRTRRISFSRHTRDSSKTPVIEETDEA